MKFIRENVIIILLILGGSILRLWNYTEIPFTHDEFSALFRTQFNSFSELIKYGIMPDGHPAGIQIFLYFYCKLVGFSEFWIKLPFVIMGIFSIYLVWKIANEWFSINTAILSTATVAFLQYFIMYSQIARPYISGLFFTLIMSYFWYHLIFKSSNKKDFIINSLGFSVGTVLCSYNHYFSLLMVGLIYGISLFFINRKNILWLVISLFISLILYLPHLKIFYHQLSLGGLGWLGKPEISFFKNFIFYMFHNNAFIVILSFLAFTISLFFYFKNKATLKKEHFITLILSITPAFVGYFYSIYRAPVLQYSVLIFSMPYFIMFMFSFLDNFKSNYIYLFTVIWSTLLLYTLIFERKHYHFFYHSIYKETFIQIKDFVQKHPDESINLCTFRKDIGYFYANRYHIDTNKIYFFDHFKSNADIYSIIDDSTKNFCIFSTVTNHQVSLFPLIKEYFPHELKHYYLDQGSIYILSKIPINKNNNDEKPIAEFSITNNTFSINHIFEGENYTILNKYEFDVTTSIPTSTIVDSNNVIIDAIAWIKYNDSTKSAHLVLSIEKDSTLLWQSYKINAESIVLNKWIPVCVSIYFPDFNKSINNSTLKAYIWNPEKTTFKIRYIKLLKRKVNPYIYWIQGINFKPFAKFAT